MIKKFIKIEGGLGTQILGMIAFLYSTEIKNNNTFLDLSYYKDERKRPYYTTEGLAMRLWALEPYGFKIEQLLVNDIKNKICIKREVDSKYLEKALDHQWNHFFPITPTAKTLLNQIRETQGGSEFTVVHIRAGDYLNVSARYIQIEEVLPILKQIKLDRTIIFTSDSPVNEQTKEKASTQLSSHDLIFLDKPNADQHQIHCLMRHANTLICSNSTFSFTASVLREAPMKVLAPTHFFGIDSRFNALFQRKSDWMFI